MKIYTSYFAKGKTLRAQGIKMISIALFSPSNIKCSHLMQVAPTYSILYDKYRTEERYTHRYYHEVLGKLNPQEILNMITTIGQGQDVALCCYEKPGDFCHRHLLAQWLMDNTGVVIEEFGTTKPVPKEGMLF